MPLTEIAVKTWIAALKQTGTSAPTARVLHNTLGSTITWTRISAGYYRGTVTEPIFTEQGTWIANSGPTSKLCMYPLSLSSINDYGYQLYWESETTVLFQLYDNTYSNIDMSTVLGDGAELNLPEIRVYSTESNQSPS